METSIIRIERKYRLHTTEYITVRKEGRVTGVTGRKKGWMKLIFSQKKKELRFRKERLPEAVGGKSEVARYVVEQKA